MGIQSGSFRNFPMLDVFPLSRRARALCGVFTVWCIGMACRQAKRLHAIGDHFRWEPSHSHLSQMSSATTFDVAVSLKSNASITLAVSRKVSVVAGSVISNTAALLAENNVSDELEGEKDPYLHFTFLPAPSLFHHTSHRKCDVYRMLPLLGLESLYHVT